MSESKCTDCGHIFDAAIHSGVCVDCGGKLKRIPSTQRKGTSNAQFNNRYVRSDRGHKAEVANASKDSLRGTGADRPSKVATPQ